MINGKKIQNFITFQTKDTIFLKKNQPQLIVHEQTIETDSFKQLLSTQRSKHKNYPFQNPFRQEKENRQSNEPQIFDEGKKSRFGSSNSRNTSKQRSLSSKYKNRHHNQKIGDHIKQFDLNNKDAKRLKSNKQKLDKKTKSLIRLPKYSQKNVIEQDKSKICRKSYSPNRNYSQGLKRTNPNNYSTQCIKTTKFTDSKDTTVKQHLKSIKNDKNLKKDSNQLKIKNTKSKEKLKSHLVSVRNLNEHKNWETQRRKDQAFSKIEFEKSKKLIKKSPSKKVDIPKKKTQEKSNKIKKQKVLSKKRKSMSKSKKNIHFQSVDDMLLKQQNYETTRNQTTGLSNYLSHRDSFKKKVKTDRDSFNPKPKKKVQNISKQKDKEIIVSSKNLKRVRNQAAIKIQKVYKGYITRKWLSEYLKIINAAVIIQKHWRGYIARKSLRFVKQKINEKKIQQKETKIERIDLIVQEQKSREISFQDSKINNIDKWKDILFEVMEEKTVNEALKSRIKHFLQTEHESGRASFVSQKSQRSKNSQQKLHEEIMSQKRYFEKRQQQQLQSSAKKRHKKYNSQDSFSIVQQNDIHTITSPLTRKSFTKQSQLLSPSQNQPISPKLRRSQSPQQMISHLHQIQNTQKRNIILSANTQKRQLQQMLKKSIFSPKSYSIKEKQINDKMQEQLKSFQKNIKGVIESCKQSSFVTVKLIEAGSFDDGESLMMTPEHSSVRQSLGREDFEGLSGDQVMSKLFEKVENGTDGYLVEQQAEQQLQFKNARSVKIQVPPHESQPPTYQNFQTFNINALSQQQQQKSSSSQQKHPSPQQSSQQKPHHFNPPTIIIKKIDPSCTFLDQYLLTMIQYMRNKNDGQCMTEIVKNIKTYRNLQPYVVLRNLSVVNDDDNNDGEEDGFGLPLYKYLEDDSQIVREEYVRDFNKYFAMMKESGKFGEAIVKENVQMQKREQTQLQQVYEHYLKLLVDSFNQALNLKRPCHYIFTDRSIQSHNSQLSLFQTDIQSQYDIYCAGAMQQIFTWLNIKYGCRVSIDEEETSVEQVIMQDAQRLKIIVRMEAEKKWDQYYQRIQTIAKIGEEIFDQLIIKQTITILNVERKFLKERELLR